VRPDDRAGSTVEVDPKAFFSLVSSQWKSTTRTGGNGSEASSMRRSKSVNGFSIGVMYVRPWKFSTATSVPSAA